MVRFLHLTGLIGRALHTTPGVPIINKVIATPQSNVDELKMALKK